MADTQHMYTSPPDMTTNPAPTMTEPPGGGPDDSAAWQANLSSSSGGGGSPDLASAVTTGHHQPDSDSSVPMETSHSASAPVSRPAEPPRTLDTSSRELDPDALALPHVNGATSEDLEAGDRNTGSSGSRPMTATSNGSSGSASKINNIKSPVKSPTVESQIGELTTVQFFTHNMI